MELLYNKHMVGDNMKTVLITGVCGGMGSATAKFLIKKGYNVVGIDYKEFCDIDGILYFKADISSKNALEAIYDEFVDKSIRLDAICHFAGIYNMDSLVEISEEDMMKIFNVNFFGVYRVNKIFLPLLNDKSRIVITSSELAPLDPLPFTGLYGITKGALEKYAYSLRMELNLLEHKVIVIRPGAVKTAMLNDSTSSIDKFIDKTVIYKDTSTRFKRIVDSVENKNIDTIKIAKLVYKGLTKKKPKFIYNINRNILLRLLNILPDRLQVYIIGKLLK
jgi:NAD(P)-dependent dehydrogenase (short-subunit alcohol dehydrogenase family)